MRPTGRTLLVVALCAGSGCATTTTTTATAVTPPAARPAPLPMVAPIADGAAAEPAHGPDNAELVALAAEDQSDRAPLALPPEQVTPEMIENFRHMDERDRRRRGRVSAIIAAGGVHTATDYLSAATVFQHGDTLDDFARARALAYEAAKHGDKRARTWTAMAWDRWLVSAGYPQRFGTQQHCDEHCCTELVDPSVDDVERARWGVKPLAAALTQAPMCSKLWGALGKPGG